MTRIARNAALAISACAMCAISSPGSAAIFMAVDDSYTTPENTELFVNPGVLSNDSPGGFTGINADFLNQPAHGTLFLTFNSDGGFDYTPNSNFTGIDTFTYQDVASNGTTSNTATVRIDVTATPLPAALPMFASGLGAMGLLGWRRKRKAQGAIAA